MRRFRVLCGAAVVAAIVSSLASCGDGPTTAEPGARAVAPRSLIFVPSPRSDTSLVTTSSTSSDEPPADTSGVRRGVQMGGGGN